MGLPAVVYVGFIFVPIVALVYRAATAESLGDVITSPILRDAIKVTLITSLLALAITVAAGTPLAYILARKRFPGRDLLDVMIDMPLVLPPVVAGIALLMAFGRRGILGGALDNAGINLPFTTAAVVIAQVFVASPFYIRAAKAGFQGVDTSLENISQALGVSPWRTFWKVTVPLSAPSLTAGLVLAWARAMSEFGATLLFAGNFQGRTQTFSLAIVSATEVNLGAALVLSVILLGISLLLLLGLYRFAHGNTTIG
ncbi:MAG: molybdate ABC transporter permease subunit [Dehalococcoidia bacterium]|nr:molybdate ABC transporter permease subunit [Dehalococcoidia bacterium]